MTHFLQDILRQPLELQSTIAYLCGAGRRRLAEAAAVIRSARHVFLTGIGGSWHAALTAGRLFSIGGSPGYVKDPSAPLQVSPISSAAGVIRIPSSGPRA